MNQIQKTLFYGGLEPQDYRDCQPDIAAENRNKLHVYLDTAVGLLFIITCLSGGLKVLRHECLIYGIAFVVCTGMRMADMMFPEKNGLFLKWQMYGFAALLYVMGIAVSARNPGELSVSFIAFVVVVPMLFVMPPIRHIANVAFFDVVFIIVSMTIKEGNTQTTDIVNAVFFGVISCIISTFTMRIMYQNAISRKKLDGIANFDVLTGIKNRNAYENEREGWPSRCSVSLSCVYVDVNGLHERNNLEGHENGDRMLQTVATEMRNLFGTNNCYRTGGDEFVAFVADQQYVDVRKTVEQMSFHLGQQGYSVAVGVATESAGGIDISALARRAEERMYLAKEEHYRALNQSVR